MSEIGEAPAKRRRDASATRQALLVAARTLMSERGVAGTSTRDIAARAGVNQTLVYRYFGSKEKLVGEAVGGGSPTVDVAAVPLSEVPQALVEDMVERSEEAAERDGTAFWSLLGGADDETVRDAIREHITSLFDEQLAPRLDGADPELRAELFAALLVGVAFLRTKVRTPALAAADRDALARHAAAMAAALFDARD